MHWTPSWWYKGWQLSSLKGVRRIPTLRPRLQTRHRVPCKQDFRFKPDTERKERKSKICKTGFPNLQIGASFKACSPLTWSSGDRLHFAGAMCLSSQVFKMQKQKNTKIPNIPLKYTPSHFSTATKSFCCWSSSSLSVASSLQASPISLKLKRFSDQIQR